MKFKSWRSMVFGDTNMSFRHSLTTYCGILTLFTGVFLILRGVAGEGTVDIKMAIVQGKLQSGSIGILFSFLGFILLVVCYTYRGASKLELNRCPDGALTINHKGAFTDTKAKSIRILLGDQISDEKEATNKAMGDELID